MLNNELLEAYKAAKYIFRYESNDIRLRFNEACSEVDDIFEKQEAKMAFFITPENPFSLELSQAENSLRHTRFKQTLIDNNCTYFEGYGTDENEMWSKEISYMIFTDNEALMHLLAGQFGQNAFISIKQSQKAKLCIIAPINYAEY
jgi:hypothetical protein